MLVWGGSFSRLVPSGGVVVLIEELCLRCLDLGHLYLVEIYLLNLNVEQLRFRSIQIAVV